MYLDFRYCPQCGAEKPPKANFCPQCGYNFGSMSHTAAENLSVEAFLPSVLTAFEKISVSDFFRTFTTAKTILTQPQDYERLDRAGKLNGVYASLVTATLAGVFKLFQDPYYSPYMQRLETGDDFSKAIVQFSVLMVLALGFGLFALVAFGAIHSLFRLSIPRKTFLHFSLVAFNSLSFLTDSLSPFWMVFVREGMIPFGSALVDVLRGLLILASIFILHHFHSKKPERSL